MTTKTITVTEDAYAAVRRLKNETESFSDLFLRLGKRCVTVSDIRGILKHTPEQAAEFSARVRAVHERLGKGFEERKEYVRARLKQLD